MAGLPKSYIKKYGISKQAWREYRKDRGITAGSKVKTVAKKRKSGAKKGGGRRGSRLIGNIGIKGMLTGGFALFAAQSLLPGVGGVYNPAVQKIAAGVGAKAVGISGAALTGAGLMEAGALILRQFLSGGLALPFLGGGGNGNGGGYDY